MYYSQPDYENGARQSFTPNDVLLAATGSSIGLKTSMMTSQSGYSPMARQAASLTQPKNKKSRFPTLL